MSRFAIFNESDTDRANHVIHELIDESRRTGGVGVLDASAYETEYQFVLLRRVDDCYGVTHSWTDREVSVRCDDMVDSYSIRVRFADGVVR